MTETAEKLYREALDLTPNERIGLVEELLNSLDKPDASEPNKQAIAESELRRLWEKRSGAISTQVLNEFFVTVSLLECSLSLLDTVVVIDGTCLLLFLGLC